MFRARKCFECGKEAGGEIMRCMTERGMHEAKTRHFLLGSEVVFGLKPPIGLDRYVGRDRASRLPVLSKVASVKRDLYELFNSPWWLDRRRSPADNISEADDRESESPKRSKPESVPVELGLSSARPARMCNGKLRCPWAESGQRAARGPLEDAPSGFELDRSTARLLLRGFRISSVISKSRAGGIAAADWLRFMSSSLDLLAPSLETAETTKEIIVPVDASPFEITTGEKRKREGGRVRSRVWQHFTKLEKRPGEREECRCNYCGNLYVCSSKSGTTHLNRHIFEGGCPKYKPTLSETQNLTSYPKDDLDDDDNMTPLRVDAEHSTRSFSEQEVAENLASELVQLKEENTKLLHERDDLATQKTSLEQLIVTMATETARLMEENTKLKEECAKLQEEKQKTVTREEFVQLETQVSKLREDFERDRRGFPAATMAALAHLQNGR